MSETVTPAVVPVFPAIPAEPANLDELSAGIKAAADNATNHATRYDNEVVRQILLDIAGAVDHLIANPPAGKEAPHIEQKGQMPARHDEPPAKGKKDW